MMVEKMYKRSKQPVYFTLIAFLLVLTVQPAIAQDADSTNTNGTVSVQQFGGPGSVPGQLAGDKRLTESLTGVDVPENYSDWKKSLLEEHGFDFTVDYNSAIVKATNTLDEEDTFSGGVVRFFGQWELTGRDSGNTGSLVWKVENRHRYSDIPPSGTKNEIGYVGLMFPTFSNIQNRLTNLYWKQNLNQKRIEIVAGFIDTTDWIDVYALAPPWTAFSNFAFATGSATIAPPDEAAPGGVLQCHALRGYLFHGWFR